MNRPTSLLVLVAIILIASFFFFITPAHEESSSSEPQASTDDSFVPGARRVAPNWDQQPGQEIPTGVWSKPFTIQPGCSTRYSAGMNAVYQIQYRFYEKDWHDRKPGASVDVSEIRFKVLKAGVTEMPFTLVCD